MGEFALADAAPPATGATAPPPTTIATVTGQITAPPGATLPPDAIVQVLVNDVSRADAPALVLGEQTLAGAATFPIAFSVPYDAGLLDPRHTYAMRVRIVEVDPAPKGHRNDRRPGFDIEAPITPSAPPRSA